MPVHRRNAKLILVLNPEQQDPFWGTRASFARFRCTPPLLRKCTEKAQKKCVLPNAHSAPPNSCISRSFENFWRREFFRLWPFPCAVSFRQICCFPAAEMAAKTELAEKGAKVEDQIITKLLDYDQPNRDFYGVFPGKNKTGGGSYNETRNEGINRPPRLGININNFGEIPGEDCLHFYFYCCRCLSGGKKLVILIIRSKLLN